MEKSTKNLNITERLEDLGWLDRPTAKQQFLNTPAVRFKYKTYDDYLEDTYSRRKSKWDSNGGIAVQPEMQRNSNSESNSASVEVVIEEEQAVEINKLLKTEPIIQTEQESKTEIVTSSNVKVKVLRPKRKKAHNNTRQVSTTCPYCLSKLQVNNLGVLECAGDKLRYWEEEFLKFNKLTDEQKHTYLTHYSDPGIFLDLYERWSQVDEKGKRSNFGCIYTNRLHNPVTRFRTNLPDPILVFAIEQSLGRPLTEEEKRGETEIWREGKRFFSDYRKGRTKVKIPLLVYPDGLI